MKSKSRSNKSRSKKRTTRRNRNSRNKSLRRRGGAAPPQRPRPTIRDANEVSIRIASAINLFSGRWARDFAVIEGHRVKLKVSASNVPSNQDAMNTFIESLESERMQINRDLEERDDSGRIVGDERIPTSRITIIRMSVSDITPEDAENMASNPTYMPLSGYDITEDLADWDSGIHKVIEFELNIE